MTIIVTGGAGFIGSNLIKKLKNDGWEHIISIDNYSSGKVENHITGVKYIGGNVVDIERILETVEVDVVFHLGNYSRIATSFEQINDVWTSNFIGTFHVTEFCRKRNIKLIYAGSSTKFSPEGIDHSPYSFTKAVSTDLITNYGKWYNLKYVICYFYNVFGPGYDSTPIPGYESVISVFEKQWKKNNPLTICGDGLQTRSFTYVEDVVDGIIKAWKYEKNDEFQLNAKDQFSILAIAKIFSENIVFLPVRKGDRQMSNDFDNHAKDILGWEAKVSVIDWINDIKKKI